MRFPHTLSKEFTSITSPPSETPDTLILDGLPKHKIPGNIWILQLKKNRGGDRGKLNWKSVRFHAVYILIWSLTQNWNQAWF